MRPHRRPPPIRDVSARISFSLRTSDRSSYLRIDSRQVLIRESAIQNGPHTAIVAVPYPTLLVARTSIMRTQIDAPRIKHVDSAATRPGWWWSHIANSHGSTSSPPAYLSVSWAPIGGCLASLSSSSEIGKNCAPAASGIGSLESRKSARPELYSSYIHSHPPSASDTNYEVLGRWRAVLKIPYLILPHTTLGNHTYRPPS